MHVWPFFDLRIVSPGVELRLGRDEELMGLALRAQGNILSEANRAFLRPWTSLPEGEFERSFLQFHWAARATVSREDWWLHFLVFPAGQTLPVGTMSIKGVEFARRRSVTTGSWLLREWQGQGIGTAMRRAVLEFAFGDLDAREARSGAHVDNHASIGVSRRLGYRDDGTEIVTGGHDEAHEAIRLRLRREDFVTDGQIKVHGVTPDLLDMLGAR